MTKPGLTFKDVVEIMIIPALLVAAMAAVFLAPDCVAR